jgi:hypothetical protein
MEPNASSTAGGEVPSLLANIEVSHLDGFDVTTPGPSPRPLLTTPPKQHPNQEDTARPARDRAMDRVTHRSEAVIPQFDSPFHPPGFRAAAPHSISLPSSPSGFAAHHHLPAHAAGEPHDLHRLSRTSAADEAERPPTAQQHGGKVVFRSQQIPGGKPARMAPGRPADAAGPLRLVQDCKRIVDVPS